MIKFVISVSILALCLLYARFENLHLFDPLLRWLGEGMDYVNSLVNWIFKPLLFLLKLLFYPFRRFFVSEQKLPYLSNSLKPADSTCSELPEG